MAITPKQFCEVGFYLGCRQVVYFDGDRSYMGSGAMPIFGHNGGARRADIPLVELAAEYTDLIRLRFRCYWARTVFATPGTCKSELIRLLFPIIRLA